LLAAAGRVSGTLPVLFHCHSYLYKWYAVALIGRQLRKANRYLIASSRFVAQPWLQYVHPPRIRIIYNGTPEIPFQDRVFPTGRRWRIGVIGRIAQEKGQLEFVQAVRILEAAGVNAEYAIHGDSMFSSRAYLDSVRAASRGLPIRFTGWHESAGPLFSELDLLVVPSPCHESTTRVVLEAYSAGTPVVAFATGGIPEIIRDGHTGILVTPPTPEALAAAIQAATRQPQVLASMAGAARRKWEEEYTVSRYEAQVLGAIEEATWNPGGGRRRAVDGEELEDRRTFAFRRRRQ
jgi:glycosyltransferase involved in cell wall biosynthesis